jgi:hypothetical protein
MKDNGAMQVHLATIFMLSHTKLHYILLAHAGMLNRFAL